MQNTGPKPSVFVRWLSLSQRMKLAAWLRDKAADVADWVCPELKDQGE
jgi:hypothetical protein